MKKLAANIEHVVFVLYLWQVSLDLVKSLYAKFIDWDLEMFDQETGVPSHATK